MKWLPVLNHLFSMIMLVGRRNPKSAAHLWDLPASEFFYSSLSSSSSSGKNEKAVGNVKMCWPLLFPPLKEDLCVPLQ